MNETNEAFEFSLPDAETLTEAILHGAAIKDVVGMSDDMMEGIYSHAYRFYKNGQVEEAESFFRFLCLYDFHNAEYSLGLGAVLQMKGEYAKAIDLYALSFGLSNNDYRPMLHTGQCHLALGKTDTADECFRYVIESSSDESLKRRAVVYREAIEAAGHESVEQTK